MGNLFFIDPVYIESLFILENKIRRADRHLIPDVNGSLLISMVLFADDVRLMSVVRNQSDEELLLSNSNKIAW